MNEWLVTNFSASGLMPHGYCFLWNPELIGLHLFADVLIATAYFSIPLTLLYFTRQRQDLPYKWVLWLFAAFITFCGMTHFFGAWTLFNPHYWLQGLMKLATGLVSIATAIILVPMTPKFLALSTHSENDQQHEKQLQQLREQLREEIGERLRLEEKLNRLKQPKQGPGASKAT